jgi:NAD(P)-dependent dehydrogenase (short-subunit alcohol dehydrogenase family)
MQRLTDKTIVVAGAGGIGDVIARRYAAEGASVVLGDRNLEGARHAVDRITASGGTAIAAELDGAEEGSVNALVALALDRFGRLDGFHANFASFADGAMNVGALEIPLEVYDGMMRINARGHLLCTRAAVPAMIENGGGTMLYTSSGAAFAGEAVRVAYAMSKAATHALMRNVASRYGAQNIRANVITPGIIMHERLEQSFPQEMKDAAMRELALKTRLGRPEDIAGLSAMLMSTDGEYISGQVISVDGGATMRQ